MIHCKRTIRAGAEHTHTAQAAPVFLHLLIFCHSNNLSIQDLAFVFSICRTLGFCWGMSPCAVRRPHSEERKSLCVHTTFLHCAHQTLRGFAYKHKFDGSKNLLMRNGQANADSSGWTSLKKHDEQFTSSTHFRWCVRHDGDHESDNSASGICQQEWNPMRTHCVDQEDMKTSSSEWHLKIWASETEFLKMWHAANLKQWKETLVMRYSVKISDTQSLCEDYHRQPRDAVNQAVRESSENYEVRMMPEFQGAQGEWKKMKEERHKWLDPMHETLHVVKRSTCCMNIKFFFKHDWEKKVVDCQMHSGATVTHCRSRRSWHERKIQQERSSQNGECQQAHRRVLLQMEEPLRTPLKENSQEVQKVRCKLLSAQQLAISLENEMSQAPTVCDSGRSK